jgi:hypothetical protein
MPTTLPTSARKKGPLQEQVVACSNRSNKQGAGGQNREQALIFPVPDQGRIFCSSGNISNQKDKENRYYDRKDFGNGVHVDHTPEFVSAVVV